MPRWARVGLMVALAALAACDGKVIHLGNGRDGGGPCPHAQVSASEVLWIGDSWILVPGSQHTRVRDAAREIGAIGANDDYTIGAVAASTMAAIADQYTAQEAGVTKVKVLIMDGGTWDTIVGMGSDASVTGAANTFVQLLAQVASDGTVDHIIYFLTPDVPGIPGVVALRPLLRYACDASTVPCHFIDLTPLWTGHPEYSVPGVIPVPTEAGGIVIADAIWSVMQQSCIAQ